MSAENLSLDPESTIVAVLDLQKGFGADGGGFSKLPKGADDLGPIKAAALEGTKFALAARDAGAKVQLIKAEYAAGKFTGGKADKALSNLCDPEADNGDCDYMDELQPLLDADPSLVDGEIVKHENDATTAPELLALIDSVSARTPDGDVTLVVTGCTVTTCVEKTFAGVKRERPNVSLVTAKDLIGARASKYQYSERTSNVPVDAAYKAMQADGVIVLETADQVEWVVAS
ncbi:isochorismatase family protein [Candidatus Peregrinibacteria bacterium]|jgi:nicotinamidase-related amidase|nr:isochorismatase family protein [Candidatus Peregrinibacteria bacterium]MBT4632312.1 isochorismatase family protein [Candidatus Peregrinibacteria bacterium]MBT5516953.1 isochorismatase family protein [Candidatus Peregrinibacteria bacterium]MBT5824133.1 isochorismatase family protein [Candidatus Peregrinibacteria bacterium]